MNYGITTDTHRAHVCGYCGEPIVLGMEHATNADGGARLHIKPCIEEFEKAQASGLLDTVAPPPEAASLDLAVDYDTISDRELILALRSYLDEPEAAPARGGIREALNRWQACIAALEHES